VEGSKRARVIAKDSSPISLFSNKRSRCRASSSSVDEIAVKWTNHSVAIKAESDVDWFLLTRTVRRLVLSKHYRRQSLGPKSAESVIQWKIGLFRSLYGPVSQLFLSLDRSRFCCSVVLKPS
jgi:hypothetical protein